jgi:hypothetical protein
LTRLGPVDRAGRKALREWAGAHDRVVDETGVSSGGGNRRESAAGRSTRSTSWPFATSSSPRYVVEFLTDNTLGHLCPGTPMIPGR